MKPDLPLDGTFHTEVRRFNYEADRLIQKHPNGTVAPEPKPLESRVEYKPYIDVVGFFQKIKPRGASAEISPLRIFLLILFSASLLTFVALFYPSANLVPMPSAFGGFW